ncbi:MAG: helix-turn-helix domain-containing protein [Clostridia bacterium]|nr:helix-turn-helix domain-containing protein [Clostridia bacterium]
MNKLDEIREKLIFEIENSGMTKSDICRQVGISTAAMAQYKSGRAMPALDTFADICKVINADANEILGIK